MSDATLFDTHDDSLRGASDAGGGRDAQLVVALECDRPLAGSARFSLAGVHEVLLGRGLERTARRRTDHGYTTLQVLLPARSMSSTHARLVRAQGRWVLEDAGSRNGSFVNGQRVERAAVGERDVIDVGRALLLLREDMDMAHAPPDLDASTIGDAPPAFRTLVPQVAEDLSALRRLAPTKVPLLLLGETGTGKELVARGLHLLSGRSGPMVPVNCGALPQSLIEAQLFGHVKGAFSGAVRDETGLVREAHQGTLFLDEVGDLPRASQTTLLRVLQEGEVTPVGSTRPVRVDVRVVSATHRALAGEDAALRPDLFARLAGFTLRLRPLRERIEDLGVALADILAAHAPDAGSQVTLAPDLGRLLLQHDWPLNFRELQQAVCAALALSDGSMLRAKHFPGLRDEGPPPPCSPPAAPKPARDDEGERLRIAVIAHLREHRGNVRAVARAMGKAPMQIHRWMRRFGIEPGKFRGGGEP